MRFFASDFFACNDTVLIYKAHLKRIRHEILIIEFYYPETASKQYKLRSFFHYFEYTRFINPFLQS